VSKLVATCLAIFSLDGGWRFSIRDAASERSSGRGLAACKRLLRPIWTLACGPVGPSALQPANTRFASELTNTEWRSATRVDSQSAKTTKVEGGAATTRPRRSSAANATPWPLPMANRLACSSARPTCRNVTVPCRYKGISLAPPARRQSLSD
jgi:hypothetical protein